MLQNNNISLFWYSTLEKYLYISWLSSADMLYEYNCEKNLLLIILFLWVCMYMMYVHFSFFTLINSSAPKKWSEIMSFIINLKIITP